jgi:hypothetical protein
MTQLIENKRPRRVLIATLLHFSPHQPPASRLQHRKPNRQIPELEMDLTTLESTGVPVLIAKNPDPMRVVVLSDNREPKDLSRDCHSRFAPKPCISNRRCCRLEFAVTACKLTATCISNRRNSAIYSFLQNISPLPVTPSFLIANFCRIVIQLGAPTESGSAIVMV